MTPDSLLPSRFFKDYEEKQEKLHKNSLLHKVAKQTRANDPNRFRQFQHIPFAQRPERIEQIAVGGFEISCDFGSNMAPVDGENLKVLPQFGFSAELSEKPNCIGMKPTVLAERKLRLKNFWIEIMKKRNDNPRYALCLENKDCEDLEKRKIYQVLPDDDAKQEGYLRVIDESK